MKPAGAGMLIALATLSAHAMAQTGSEPADEAAACSSLTRGDSARCINVGRGEASHGAQQRPAASGLKETATPDSWVLSETTSPVDYSPVVIASATANEAPVGSGMRLSIACRGGTTSVALIVPSGLPAGGRYSVSYAVDGGPSTAVAANPLPFGMGLVLVVDVVRFLTLLPQQEEITFALLGHQDGPIEGRYALAGLRRVRDRIAGACKWPPNVDAVRK